MPSGQQCLIMGNEMSQIQQMGKGVTCAILLALSADVLATESAGSSFLNGVEQFMMVSVPPAGVYYLIQAVDYDADELRDANGQTGTLPFRKKIQVVAPRIVWVTKQKIFGGRLLFQAVAPLLKVEGTRGSRSQTRSGLGDMSVGSALTYSPSDELSYAFGVIVTAPTGVYDASNLANPGRHYWSLRPRFALTYSDPEGFNGDISVSYNFNRRNSDTGYRSGQEIHVDYAAGWGFARDWVGGISGFAYRQTTDDQMDGTTIKNNRGRAFGIGPALKFDDGYGWMVTAAYQREFGVRNRPSGNTLSVRMVLPF